MAVYFDSGGIANFLSLDHLGKKFSVTYDSLNHGGVFKVYTKKGIVKFKPTPMGLDAVNLKDNPGAKYLLVNDANLTFPTSPDSVPLKPDSHHVHMTMVRNNYEGFTKKQIKQATVAQYLMGMIGNPPERVFQGLVRLNLLKYCLITSNNIKNAHAIFGLNLATIRGKTVLRKPERVITDYVDILREILNVHLCLTLVGDVMFVNSVPFLVSALCNINIITIEHAPHRTAKKLGYLLQSMNCIYAWADFTVQTILMDNKFEKVRDHVPMVYMNTTAAAEHISKIKHRI
jgi:hypothetical protein